MLPNIYHLAQFKSSVLIKLLWYNISSRFEEGGCYVGMVHH